MGILLLYQGRVGTGLPGRVHREVRGPRVATTLHRLEKNPVPLGAHFATVDDETGDICVYVTAICELLSDARP